MVVSGDEQADSLNYRYYGIAKKLDVNGDAIWEKEYKYFNTDTTQHYFYAMDLASDGGYVMAGMTIDLHYGASPTNEMWMVKTDSLGCDNASCLLTTSISTNGVLKKEEVLIYPNPFCISSTIEITIEPNIKYDFILYDQFGRVVKEIMNITEKKTIIQKNDLDSGMYFYKAISTGNIIGTGKILVN